MRAWDAVARIVVLLCTAPAVACDSPRPPASHPAEAVVQAPPPDAATVPTPPRYVFREAAVTEDVDWARGIAAEDLGFARLEKGDAEGALASFQEACTLRAECTQARAGAALALRALGEDRGARELFARVRADAERRSGETAHLEEKPQPPVGLTVGSPIGSRWAVATGTQLVLSRATTLREIARIPLPKHEGPVPGRFEEYTCAVECSAAAFSRDGKWLAETSVIDSVRLFDLTGQSAPIAIAHDAGRDPMAVAFSPDSSIVASNVKTGIALFDVKTRARLRVVPGTAPIAFSDDGTRIHTSNGVFDVATGKEIAKAPRAAPLPRGTPEFRRITSPDAKLLFATAVIDDAVLVDVATSRELRRWKTGLAFEGAAFAPDGGTIAAWGSPARILLLDPNGSQPARELDATDLMPRKVVDGAIFSPDGKLLLARGLPPSGLAVWDVSSGARLSQWRNGDARPVCVAGIERLPAEACEAQMR
jgi:hypothetical protein